MDGMNKLDRKQLLLYYNERTDQLGIAEPTWDYICLTKFVPFVAELSRDALVTYYEDPVKFIEHPIAEEKSSAWVVIGIL